MLKGTTLTDMSRQRSAIPKNTARNEIQYQPFIERELLIVSQPVCRQNLFTEPSYHQPDDLRGIKYFNGVTII
ncbi:hypothetical protein [Methanogenium organophilum]|uniref:Uncharacterized protein n=1 Tax=Methanogenium organophilum TaxID=2199 RepID=A0A9X9S638_METOG|nr:hypothetical protein [Methanogenium organophilum]WAI01580.1 hypothetical protein OU421_01530 [Methanogenium organophilum]